MLPLRLRPHICCKGGLRLMLRGAIRPIISFCESSLGHSAFCVVKDSCQELSCELAGEGGAPLGSVIGQVDDLAGKASWEAGGLGARNLALNGLKGPRGKGSTRGRGGNRRSSPKSAPRPLEDKERTLLKTESEKCFSSQDLAGKAWASTHGREH